MPAVPAVLACLIFLGAYVLIATERWVGRTAAALAGAGLVLGFGISGAQEAFFSPESGIDWNVIVLLFGMMVIVSVLGETGIFEFLAIWAAKRARGRPFPLMVLLILITAVASALLDNVTTVLLVAPVTIVVCRRLGLPVVPFLLAEVFAANIGGAATLVGDPPNIIIASRAGLSFNDFLVHMAPVVVVLLVVLVLLCRWLFAGALRGDPDRVAEVLALNERDAIRDRRLLWQSLAVLVLVLGAFVAGHGLGYAPSVVALLGAGLLVAVTRVSTEVAFKDVEWGTLAFFMGLFVMVGGLVTTGVLDAVARAAAGLAEQHLPGFTLALLWGSGVLSGIVDNIPYVAATSPVVAEIVGTDDARQVLWWSLALGADLGGNFTLIGASANVVVAGIAARNGARISFGQFTRYGAVVTTATLVISTAVSMAALLRPGTGLRGRPVVPTAIDHTDRDPHRSYCPFRGDGKPGRHMIVACLRSCRVDTRPARSHTAHPAPRTDEPAAGSGTCRGRDQAGSGRRLSGTGAVGMASSPLALLAGRAPGVVRVRGGHRSGRARGGTGDGGAVDRAAATSPTVQVLMMVGGRGSSLVPRIRFGCPWAATLRRLRRR